MGSLNKKINFKKIAKEVIDLEIKALQKLKKTLNKNFDEAVNAIVNCQSKVILCGVGKSGIIANKISATLSSIGTPSFSLSANDCSHGNMGSITRKDVLILISYSGNSLELKNIINYANRNKVLLIGITSKKNSDLFKNSDIGLITPEVKEAGLDMIPTSSTINQLSIGDALAISTLKKRKINNLDFKKFHPSGSLGEKLKTAEDLMLTKEKYLDMIKAGIIDPTLVTRTAVQNAASVAGLLLTTEAVISDKPEPAAPAAPAMPDMGGMGGMGGMM